MHVKPAIWRQILVDSAVSLGDLHKIVQTTIGWTNSHLHQFIHNDKFYCLPGEDDYPNENQLDYSDIKLDNLITKIGESLTYEYDFGDGWEHEIKLEKILPADPKAELPRCIAGERNCPPEDCGGTGGYEEILEALKNSADEQFKGLLEWIGDDYDPDFFDLEEVNSLLKSEDYGCLFIMDE